MDVFITDGWQNSFITSSEKQVDCKSCQNEIIFTVFDENLINDLHLRETVFVQKPVLKKSSTLPPRFCYFVRKNQ